MARKRRKGHADHGGGGGGGHGGASARWLVSYADFITLLFVVFLVLFSMARLDAEKYGTLARSLNQAMGPVGPDVPPLPARGELGTAMPVTQPERPGNLPDVPDWPAHLIAELPEEPVERAPIPPAEPPPADATPSQNPADPVYAPPPAPPDPLQGLAESFQDTPGARTGLVSVALEDSGIVLSVAGNLLFNPGEYVLRPDAKAHLAEIAQKLKGVELPIMVNGTADATQPAGSAAAFELAALRAGAVVRYFNEEQGIPSKNFVYFGYGDGSAQSDRVTIIVARKR